MTTTINITIILKIDTTINPTIIPGSLISSTVTITTGYHGDRGPDAAAAHAAHLPVRVGNPRGSPPPPPHPLPPAFLIILVYILTLK